MRRMTRSQATQVAPDFLLRHRFEDRLAIGGPFDSPVARLFPLFATGDLPSAFSEVGPLRVEGRPGGHDAPVIRWDTRAWHRGAGGVGSAPRDGQNRTALFSLTSKMDCPSFSLPSGPTTEGGSCAAANRPAGGRPGTGGLYVCDTCYALEGQYGVNEVAIAQAARWHWVLARCRADPSGAALAEDLAKGLADYARFTTLSKIRDGAVSRLGSELGTWQDGRVLVPLATGTTTRLYPAFESSFDGTTTGAWAARVLGPVNGDITGFVRVHDSGDLTVGSPRDWITYTRAWALVAAAFPRVVTWLPTRAWIFPAVARALAEAKRRAPSLVVRPSALRVGDPPPRVPGLDAGTTVVETAGGSRGGAMVLPPATTACPVYVPRWDPGALPRTRARLEAGEHGEWITAGSCREAGCRRCWVDPLAQVAYGLH